MSGKKESLASFVKQRLLNLAVANREDFNLVLVRYATERLLYRLSVSPHRESFLLKGAMLFVIWERHPHRPTRDVDILFLKPYDLQELESIFRTVVERKVVDDGLRFDPVSVRVEAIRETNTYGGIRIKLHVFLGSARIPVQVDVGLGDAVHPEPVWTEFATLLEFPAPPNPTLSHLFRCC